MSILYSHLVMVMALVTVVVVVVYVQTLWSSNCRTKLAKTKLIGI